MAAARSSRLQLPDGRDECRAWTVAVPRIDDLLAAARRSPNATRRGCRGARMSGPGTTTGRRRSWFLYVIRVAAHVDRDCLMIRLAARGITSRLYFWPIHLQTFYMDRFGFAPGDFPLRRSGRRVDARTPDAARHLAGRCRLRLRCPARRAPKTMSANGVALAVDPLAIVPRWPSPPVNRCWRRRTAHFTCSSPTIASDWRKLVSSPTTARP